MGKTAIESAVKILNGERPPAEVTVKLEMITKDSMAAAKPAAP
jgi:hypothetical protein